MRIAFHLMGKSGWLGGGIYLQTVCQALKQTNGSAVTISLLAENGYPSDHAAICALVDDVITYPPLVRWTPTWAKERISLRLRRRGMVNDQVLRERRVDVIAFGEAPEGSRIPALGWIPDFQHRHFPEFFSADECRDRDASFSRLVERSARVILISESVNRDFTQFFPEFRHRSRVLRPITLIPTSVYDTDPRQVCDLYNLPAKFLYLPNQFWKHKNHITVFRALSMLKKKNTPVFLVCSGNLG